MLKSRLTKNLSRKGAKAQREDKSQKKKAVSSIGTFKERSLHSALKFRYSGSEGSVEALTGSFVCDACTSEGELIEVQTGSFGPLKEKVKSLCKTNKVRIIHPIVIRKHIELYDSRGKLLHKRKSPKKGNEWDLFKALLYAPELGLLKNLTIELAIIDVLEKRVNDGKGSWRRKGISIVDRFLDAWHGSIVLSKRSDYYQFIPFKKGELFTARDLAEKAGINATLAGKTLYTLAKMSLLEKTGKRGNAFIYKRK